MNQINPKSLKIVHRLPPFAAKGDKVAIDSEFFGQDKNRLHRPHGQFAFLGCTFDGETIYYITDSGQIQDFFDRLDQGVWIFHHAKYDLTQLRRFAHIPNRKKLWDTMLIEQIQYSGYYNEFSLADVARRRLDVYLPKETRKSFSDAPEGHSGASTEMSPEQIEYSATDVAVTFRVYQSQRAEIDETDLGIWKDIELPTLWSLLSMRGMKMDVDAWTALYEKNKSDADNLLMKYIDFDQEKYALEDAVKKKKYTGISLGSNDQVGKEILRRGYKLPKTKTGKPSTGEDDIKHLVDDEFVQDVLEYRGKKKLASTYGKSWISKGLIEEDGLIYSDFYQIGAATGRFSSSKPNVENIPVRETPEFRKCFVARDGYVLIDADWSAQEPRIAAYLSQDEQLIRIFKEHKDVYIESARLMFGWELDKKDPRRKERMKPTVLGASYGLTEFGMEKKYQIPKDEGKELLDTFFDTFTGMRDWKKEQIQKKDYVTTIYGRKYWLNSYQQGSDNNSLNSPVQGSASDAMKIAGSTFQQTVEECGYSDCVFIVNYIHDELLIECREDMKDWTMKTLKSIMIETAENMHDGIPADVEIGCGKTWHEAHG